MDMHGGEVARKTGRCADFEEFAREGRGDAEAETFAGFAVALFDYSTSRYS